MCKVGSLRLYSNGPTTCGKVLPVKRCKIRGLIGWILASSPQTAYTVLGGKGGNSMYE